MTIEFHDRSEWTSTGRGGSYLSGGRLRGVACHWPGTATSAFGVESDSEVARRLRAWRNYHVSGNGWSDIGYGLAVSQNGGAWDLRGLRRVGAHSASPSNPDANHEWVGVLFILGADEEPTDDMIGAFQRLRTEVILEEFPNATDLRGHGGVPGASTACPGGHVFQEIRSGSLAGAPDNTTEDDMPSADEVADAVVRKLRDPEGRGALANGHGHSLKNGAASRPAFRELAADGVLSYTNPTVVNGERPVYWLIRATFDHARKTSSDLITIINLLTENGVQLDSSVIAQIEELRDEHQEIIDLFENESPNLFAQDDPENLEEQDD